MKVPDVLVLLITASRKPLHTRWEAEDEYRIISFAIYKFWIWVCISMLTQTLKEAVDGWEMRSCS